MSQSNPAANDEWPFVVKIGDYLVWKNSGALEDGDMICLYGGDMSKVLTMEEYLTCPDNPPPRTFFDPFKFKPVTGEDLDWDTPVEPWGFAHQS